jgi:serine/threonine protein kinase
MKHAPCAVSTARVGRKIPCRSWFFRNLYPLRYAQPENIGNFFDLSLREADVDGVPSEERSELCGRLLDGRYLIQRRIGLGGTGIVFEAGCVTDGGAVAVKMLQPGFAQNPDLRRRLQREAEVARKVPHPGIIPVLDDGVLADGSPYLVMPRMYGESLSRLLLRQGRLACCEASALGARVASILHSVHAAGFVHRDVKPEHVLLNRDAVGELMVYLLDFGVCTSRAAPAEELQQELGKVFGTPSYVSPEQASGRPQVDGRADLFSLGVVMFEALTGRLPFNDRPVSKLLLSIIHADAPRLSTVLPSVEPELESAVGRLLEREPENRFENGRAAARALLTPPGERAESEQRIAAMVNANSRITDLAPTVRRRVPTPRRQAA